jgi:predicted nucleic acid-binding protein
VTIGELTQWANLRHWGPRNRGMLDSWLSDKPVIPGARSIAVIWGQLSAGATVRGRPRPVNDTWVAAWRLAYGLPLATLNIKDFAGLRRKRRADLDQGISPSKCQRGDPTEPATRSGAILASRVGRSCKPCAWQCQRQRC